MPLRPPTAAGRPRNREAGAALLITLITVLVLLSIGAVTVLGVQTESAATGHGRFQAQALLAAESGVAAGVEFLRGRCEPDRRFSALVSSGNATPLRPDGLAGNGLAPGAPGNPFAAETDAWYEVTVLNDRWDPGLQRGEDTDGVVALRAVGHGPGGAAATILVEVRDPACDGAGAARFELQSWHQER